jgi:hypothetical protein
MKALEIRRENVNVSQFRLRKKEKFEETEKSEYSLNR